MKLPNPADRWTYHCRKATSAIDYILASQSLNATRAGIELRGLFGVPGIATFDTVTSDETAAADHAAV